MITSTSSPDPTRRADALTGPGRVSARLPAPRSDRISDESATFLRAALVRQPEIRPDVVARARAFAADSAYPPVAVMRMVAQTILASSDPDGDES